VILALVLGALAGCAAQRVWSKPRASIGDLRRDHYACVQRGRTYWSAGGAGWFGAGLIFASMLDAQLQANRLYQLCMEAHGYAEQLDSGVTPDPQVVRPGPVSVAPGSAERWVVWSSLKPETDVWYVRDGSENLFASEQACRSGVREWLEAERAARVAKGSKVSIVHRAGRHDDVFLYWEEPGQTGSPGWLFMAVSQHYRRYTPPGRSVVAPTLKGVPILPEQDELVRKIIPGDLRQDQGSDCCETGPGKVAGSTVDHTRASDTSGARSVYRIRAVSERPAVPGPAIRHGTGSMQAGVSFAGLFTTMPAGYAVISSRYERRAAGAARSPGRWHPATGRNPWQAGSPPAINPRTSSSGWR
jgi:hypothetical protein